VSPVEAIGIRIALGFTIIHAGVNRPERGDENYAATVVSYSSAGR
jgi:hypothetical protein